MTEKNNKYSSLLLFLLGLGSATKIFFLGTLAISELVIFFVAPILFACRFSRMRAEGFMTFLYMLAFMTCGLLASSWWNDSPMPFVVKQFAVFYGFFAYYVVFYALLRDNFNGIGWFFLGLFFSGIITIWAFNPTAQVSSSGFAFVAESEAEEIIQGPLFWIGKVRGLGQLPIFAAYLKTPLAYSIVTPILFVAFAMFTTVSGRAQSMCVLVGGAMMLLGRKSRATMQGIGRHFWTFMAAGVLVLFCYKAVYSYAAREGILGEAAQNKYLHQTDQGTGIVKMLVAGRTEFFIALTAIVDHPIIGFGPRAEDKKGYAGNFLLKYGTASDISSYYYYERNYLGRGMVASIPTHSHIMAGWVWCGLPGLVFFLWMLYTIYQHLRFYSACIPQWFGYFALTIPSMIWSIFFNPFGARYTIPLLMVCIHFARAIGRGRLQLPYEMEMEARKHD